MMRKDVLLTLSLLAAGGLAQAAIHGSDNATCVRLPWPREPGTSAPQLTDMSSVVYVPAHQKWLAVDQDADYHRVWCFNADGTQYGTAGHTASITCGGYFDHEDMTLVDPYNRNGFQDILVDHNENGEQLCIWSVSNLLARCEDGGAITPIRDSIPIGSFITASNSEGLTFYPDTVACPGALYGGCFLLSSRQWGPLLKRFYLDSGYNVHVVDANGFDLSTACGWPSSDTGQDTSEFKYDWIDDRFYFESDSRDTVCVTTRDFQTRLGSFTEPPNGMIEGFDWGSGRMMFVDDQPGSYDYRSMVLCTDVFCSTGGTGSQCGPVPPAAPANLRVR